MPGMIVRPLLLAITLLLAQMGALFHATGHLADPANPPESLCEWCTAFATLGATAPSPTPFQLAQVQQPQPITVCPTTFQTAPLRLAYHSQAPPVLS